LQAEQLLAAGQVLQLGTEVAQEGHVLFCRKNPVKQPVQMAELLQLLQLEML
jgi:hypothetical protein